MTIKELIQEVEEISLEEMNDVGYVNGIREKKPKLSKADKRSLRKKYANYRKEKEEMTLKSIFIYSIWLPDEAIEEARKKGIFRYKPWGNNCNYSEMILRRLMTFKEIFQYSEETLKFIYDKLQLSWLRQYYYKTECRIKKCIYEQHSMRLRKKCNGILFEESLAKDLLAYVDAIFYLKTERNQSDFLDKNIRENYSIEDISEAISYLIYIYDDIIGIEQNKHYIISAPYVKSEKIEKLIMLACKMNQVQEWEISVDYFDYKVKNNKNDTRIYSMNEEVEKSIRLGYYRRDIQEYIYNIQCTEKYGGEVVSIQGGCDFFRKENNNDYIKEIRDQIQPRYRFEMPRELLTLFENTGKLFEEEIRSMGHFSSELLMNWEDCCQKKITENCNLFDVVLFQRFFIMTNSMCSNTLYEKKDTTKILNSLIPFFSEEYLVNCLEEIIGDKGKGLELLRLFTYNGGTKLDLQYTPFIKMSGGYVFPLSLTTRTNLVRNCIAQSYLVKNQVVNRDELEPIVKFCERSFSACSYNYEVYTNKKFTYENQCGEADVIVICETDIIIIECKAPLNPTSNFEMRATVDHLNKAVKQLDLCKKAFEDASFWKQFCKNYKITRNERQVRTCILLGNRLFNGTNLGEHPIRYVRELDMLLTGGIIYSNIGNWRIWKGEQFSHGDILTFLSNDNLVRKTFFKAMEKQEQFVYANGKKLIFETYALNQETLVEIQDDCFDRVDEVMQESR